MEIGVSQEIYDRLAFNGYNVTYYSNDFHEILADQNPTIQSVMDMGWTQQKQPFPSIKTFVHDLYDIFGDVVGRVEDNAGNVLYDNMDEMNEIYNEMNEVYNE